MAILFLQKCMILANHKMKKYVHEETKVFLNEFRGLPSSSGN